MCPGSRRLYETVVDSILELVEVRRLRPGDALPADRELSEVFGVSRNVLRQAFGVLEERGLLRIVRGSGGPEGRGPEGRYGLRPSEASHVDHGCRVGVLGGCAAPVEDHADDQAGGEEDG
ncbi:winged helix-turn-helix transcriptional regulator [Streptomyces sp. 110]|uniref:Winged helix-turn-helix transcriptional regulator n=1 Tax=Streptomyces endocoffeicus TaxID=2898945 RepID=A0ABS1Q709_9ACTN|nr:winged helix-turn-helix transcriptional regulator [Streptomyces endocoffeicus]